MLTLIGTGHVFDLSSSLIKILDEKNPDMICIELDEERYELLINKYSDFKKYKNNRKNLPILYKLYARFQNNVAKKFGVKSGEDMYTAIKYAKTHKVPIGLIDMNAIHLYEKVFNSMSFSEKFKITLIGVLLASMGWAYIRKKNINSSLEELENNLDGNLDRLGEDFPTLKKILIDERNNNMAKKIIQFNKKYQETVACIGEAHIPGISGFLKINNIKYELVRLNELT